MPRANIGEYTVAVRPTDRRRRFLSIKWEGSPDPSDIIAIVMTQPDGAGTVWFNTRIARGRRLAYVDLWARYALAHGRRFDAVRLFDLERMEAADG